MSVMMSNHAGELLTRLVGADTVLVACPAKRFRLRSDRRFGSHAPKSEAPPFFLKRALRIPRRPGIAVENISPQFPACQKLLVPEQSQSYATDRMTQAITYELGRTAF